LWQSPAPHIEIGMNFASDNWTGPTDAVAAAIARHSAGYAPAYGEDPLTKSVTATFSALFERAVEVFFVASGTAANTLSMTALARPSGLVFSTPEAHMMNDEFNAPEFFTGMKLVPVASEAGLMRPEALRAALAALPPGHTGPPTALTLTNASEYGTVYEPGRVAELAAIAKAAGMAVHVDGARFANAVAALGATPADLTWRAGVDLMSFGGTKNGCWAAEAVVVFEPGRWPDLDNLRQRAGHGLSKQRFIAAQYEGYFADGGWLRTAAHANAMAGRLSTGIARSNAARLDWQGTANELFPVMAPDKLAELRAAGAIFHDWETLADGQVRIRLVTSFLTTPEDVDRFLEGLG
jgi:threonine aldolase